MLMFRQPHEPQLMVLVTFSIIIRDCMQTELQIVRCLFIMYKQNKRLFYIYSLLQCIRRIDFVHVEQLI